MKDLLKQIIFEQREQVYAKSVSRKIDETAVNATEIVVISGVRRCGKSVLMQQIRAKQAEKDFYLNFDDERLINFSVDDFQLLHEVFIELFCEQHTFYFDEIQNVTGWERFVRRLYDAGNKIFITGSNATMLSKELGTHLTGRFIQIELYPFSFTEFLEIKNEKITQKDFYTTAGKVYLMKLFQEYMTHGGFPQYIVNQSYNYISTLYQSILYRDVLARHKLDNEKEMLELMYYLASNASKRFTYNSLAKSIGVKHPETVKNYIKYLEDTYLINQVLRFDYSLKLQMQNAKKAYLIDNALINKIGFNATENQGQLLENLVFIELKRRGYDVYYHSAKTECDFLVRRQGKIAEAIQVSVSIKNEKTRKREINGLVEALETYGLAQGTILTYDEEEKIEINNLSITVLPVWKWLLLHSGEES